MPCQCYFKKMMSFLCRRLWREDYVDVRPQTVVILPIIPNQLNSRNQKRAMTAPIYAFPFEYIYCGGLS